VSTHCCSQDKCVPGSVCYNGQKPPQDFCEYDFECLSRCCDKNICSPVVMCVTTCQMNVDCTTECCSFGYCSASQTCQGRKHDGDVCDKDDECKSGACNEKKCGMSAFSQLKVFLIVSILLFGSVITFMLYCCFCGKYRGNRRPTTSSHQSQRDE